MKCFSFNGGRLSAGLEVRKDDKLGSVIFLGEEGRGRRYEKVGLLRKDPAQVVEGKVLDAHPVKITIENGKSFYVLARPENNGDQRILIRINTCTGYVRGGSGNWSKLKGEPILLVNAYGAYGDAGRIGNWIDDLVLLSPGDVVRVSGSRSGNWVVDYSDTDVGPISMVRQDWESKQALDRPEKSEWV